MAIHNLHLGKPHIASGAAIISLSHPFPVMLPLNVNLKRPFVHIVFGTAIESTNLSHNSHACLDVCCLFLACCFMGKILHCGELTRANLSLQPFSKDRIRLTSQLILSQKRESDVFFSFFGAHFPTPTQGSILQ